MRRYLPHRTTTLVVAVMLVATALAFGTSQRVVDDNEQRLLEDRTQDVRGLLESLGTTYEAQMAAVAAVAQVTDGDLDQFRTSVMGTDGAAAAAERGGWALLRRTKAGFETVGTVGRPTPVDEVPPEWSSGLERAASGDFRVLGFLGGGFDRRFAMVTGRTGVRGDLIVYNEVSLLGATAGAADDSSVIAGLAIAVYLGRTPDPDQLVFGVGEPSGDVEEAIVDISGTPVLLQTGATEPLAGALATNLPRILLGAGLLLALALSSLVEITLRRRDDALATVSDLEDKNRLLDLALAEQRAAEDARAALEAELRQSRHLEALGHLAGGVAHDFNNLLAAILSYADLAADGVSDEQALADLGEIRNAARRGAALTTQLLQFSRRAPVEPVLVDVNDRVRDLARLLSRTLGEDVSLDSTLASDPVVVRADPHELDQVLLNLVVNARDAVGAGGSIQVETSRVELDADVLHLYPGLQAGPHVRIEVVDDGSGMEPEVIEHAFEPFFTTKGRGHGTGLGLATAYGIVQRHHGHIGVRSTPGEGTWFEILLPATDAEVAPTPVAGEISDVTRNGHRPGRTILLVEDEDPVRQAVRRMLERGGYRVLEAQDGATAMERYGATDVDLLVTDLVMPGAASGVDVADRFRDRLRGLPVLYMTGYGDALLDEHGVDDDSGTSVLTKPFSEDDLLHAVHEAMGTT